MEFEVSINIEIKRDFEEEKHNPRYTCYKIYLKDQVIVFANYRIFNNQAPYWYIDEFVISKHDRKQGYGSYLLKYIIDKMWSEQRLPIHIYPTSQQIPKERFIEWLVHRDFVEQLWEGKIFCILNPPDSDD